MFGIMFILLAVPVIPGVIAMSCLMSVPLHKEEALGVTGAILPYVEFQSGMSFLHYT